MKKYFKIVGIVLGVVIVLGIVGSLMDDKQSSTTSIQTAVNPEYNMANELKKDATRRVDSLKSHFNYQYDEFNKIGFYTHKNFSNDNIVKMNKKGILTCYCNSDGGKYVTSFYIGSDWLNHTHFFTLINDNKMPSQVVSISDKNNVRKVGDGYVLENVTYKREITNFDLIGMNADKEIKVRLEGDSGNVDFSLSKPEKQGFNETYELANALMILNSK